MKEIGKKIREIRAKRQMKMKTLAEKAGISVATLRYYENGTWVPPLDIMGAIADALNVEFAIHIGGAQTGIPPHVEIFDLLEPKDNPWKAEADKAEKCEESAEDILFGQMKRLEEVSRDAEADVVARCAEAMARLDERIR